MNNIEIIKINGAARYQYSINGIKHGTIYYSRAKAMKAARDKIKRKVFKETRTNNATF